MPLSRIQLPADDARLITYEDTVYKLKLTYNRDNASAFLPCSGSQLNQQVEQVLRAIIYAKPTDAMKIKTEHFYADCSFSDWQALRLIAFKKDNIRLNAHPHVISIKLTPHGLHSSLISESDGRSAKRHKSDEGGSHRRTKSSPREQESSSRHQPDEKARGRRQTDGDRSEQRVHSAESEHHSTTHTEADRNRTTHTESKRQNMQEDPQMIENIGRKKKAHRPALQFIDPPQRVLRVDMGERLSEDQLQNHLFDIRDGGRGDHISKPRKSPRLAQIELGGGGEGVQVVLRKSPRTHLPSSRQSKTSAHPSLNKLSPGGSHAMTTRLKQKSPKQGPKPRRRSSLGKMIESFLDHFW